MKVSDVYNRIDWDFPFMTACDFDNVGLLVGNMNDDVKKCVIALDCTAEVLAFAEKNGANLVLTHHPVIFSPKKSYTAGDIPFEAAKKGINIISAHTNLDTGKGGITDTLCALIGAKPTKGLFIDGFWVKEGELENAVSADELAKTCKDIFKIQIRYTDGKKPIKRIVFCSGSGGSMLDDVINSGADAYITADIKHSDFISAANKGFSLFDCGHFETENIIIEPLFKMLSASLSDIEFIPFYESSVKRL